MRLVLLGSLGLAASVALLASGAQWIRPYFYLPAWWSLLAVLAGLNRREETRGFFGMALLSVPFWLAYEALNVRLENWDYQGLPPQKALRWGGYALAYATVLPAVLETAELLRSRLPPHASRAPRPWLLSPSGVRVQRLLGLACLALPLWCPAVFFPLAWAPAFLLLEPTVAKRRPRESWLAALAEGNARPALALLLSGLACGLAWESLNFWAGGKWVYTVPWPRGPKLFEMPLLGYLGFPPFALGCASAWQAHRLWWDEAPFAARAAWAAMLALFSLLVFSAIDRRTVVSFAG